MWQAMVRILGLLLLVLSIGPGCQSKGKKTRVSAVSTTQHPGAPAMSVPPDTAGPSTAHLPWTAGKRIAFLERDRVIASDFGDGHVVGTFRCD